MTDPDQKDERNEAYCFRRFIMRAAITYDLAATPPVASIFRGLPSDDRSDVPDWEMELSRQAQLRRGIDLKRIVERFVDGLEREHGSRRAEQFLSWILDGHVSRIAYMKRGQIYADRKNLIGAIKAGGYHRGDLE